MLRRILPVCLLSLLLAADGNGAEAGFAIRRAALYPVGLHYLLDADIAYGLSATANEALENGVPLTIILRCKIERERPYLWNETLVDSRRHLQIRYHPLGQLFQMTSEGQANPQSYASLRSLLAALGTVRGLPIVVADRIESGPTYRASLSVWLDIESLPLPLRPRAYLSPSWYLSSPTYQWSFARSE